MSYLAIARKYRPATFADMVGQEHVVRTLENALRSGRIHHAYLFCGARGVGKTTAARALAKALNCAEGPTTTPCGHCGACVEIAAGSSPDLVEIDGASNNSVEDVRELRETVNYAPTRGRYKIYLVDEVHMLSKAAFNALLKTLEEPPAHVVFIFATTEPNRILDTILSRVQRFDFKRIPLSATIERLRQIATAEGATLSDHALRMIARAGEGSMRDAQSLLDKVISAAGGGAPSDAWVAETLGLVDRGLLFGFLEGVVRGDPATCLETIARVYEFGFEMSEFTSELLELFRHATFVRLSDEAARYVDLSADEIDRLRTLIADVPVDALTRTFHALLDVHDQVSRAQRPRVVLEMAVARLATTRPIEPVSALLQRLEDLERRLRAAPADGGPRARPPNTGQRTAPRESPKTARATEPEKPTPRPTPPSPAAPEPPRQEARPPRASPAPELREPAPPRPPPRRAPAPPVDETPPPDDRFAPSDDDDPGPAPARSPIGIWSSLAPKLEALGHARLAKGSPELRSGVLVIALPSGRPLAEARRARDLPEVQGLLRAAFPGMATLELVPLAGTASPEEAHRALLREAAEDPSCKRILSKLGAELDNVTDLRDP